MMFQKPALIMFWGKEAPNLVDPLDWVILNQGTTETITY